MPKPDRNNAVVQHVGLQAVSLPSHFSDGDFEQWLERFETCAAGNNWSPDQQLARLPTFLDGRAYTLFRRLRPEQRDSFASLRENFLQLYGPPEARETQWLELCNLKSNTDEDIDQYVYRL